MVGQETAQHDGSNATAQPGSLSRLPKKILVTGANGFIGSHVVDQLLARGDAVRCLVRATSARTWLADRDVELTEGDLAQPDTLASAVADCDCVIHLAGRTRALSYNEFVQANSIGVRNMVRAAAAQTTPPVVVMVSSLAAAGPAENGHPRVESDEPRPVSNYGRSKLAGEREAQALAGQVPISIVRPPIVIGPRDRATLNLFRPIKRFRVHVVPGFRQRRFSLIHTADLADALLRVADRGARLPAIATADNVGQGIYYAAADEQPTYRELGRLLGCALDRPYAVRLHLPEPVVWTVGGISDLAGRLVRRPAALSIDKVREALAGDWICSDNRLRRDLAFAPAKTLPEWIQETVRWYREAGWL